MVRRWIGILCVGSLALAAAACREEGPAEKVGRKMDDAVEDLRHGDEGSLERAGRKLDEAAEDVREDFEGEGE